MEHPPMTGWCVVIAKPMAECIAARSLTRNGFANYLPMQRKILRGHRASKGQPVLRPLFPRYLFAALEDGQQWSPILRATGISNVIWCGQAPALIDGGVVEAIRDAERACAFDDARETELRTDLPPGTVVRVDSGPFQSFIGKVISAANDQFRVMVLLDIFGRGTKAEMLGSELTVIAA